MCYSRFVPQNVLYKPSYSLYNIYLKNCVTCNAGIQTAWNAFKTHKYKYRQIEYNNKYRNITFKDDNMQGDLFWEEIQKTEHRNAEFSDPELRYAVRNAVEYRNICVQCAVYSVCTLVQCPIHK